MREPIQTYFRVGTIPAVSFPGANQVDVIHALARDSFFDYIELEHVLCSSGVTQIRRCLEQGHLAANYSAHWVILSKNMNPNDLDESARQNAESALMVALEEASHLTASRFTFLAGNFSLGREAEGLVQLEKTILAVCRRAEALGIQVELELFDYDLDKRSLIGPAPRAAAFAARIRERASNFGLLADLSHFPATRESSRFVLRTLRPFLTHFHIGNIVTTPGKSAFGDLHPRFGFADSHHDIFELANFLSLLRGEGFFDAANPYPLTFEVRPQPGDTPEIVLANAKRTLQRAWSLLED